MMRQWRRSKLNFRDRPKERAGADDLGDIAMKKEEPEKALKLLREATQLRDDVRMAYMDLASILVDQKQYPEALVALRQAEKLDPRQTDAHFRMGRVYSLMGDETAAEKEFAKVRELKQQEEKEEEDVASKLGKGPAR